MTSSIRATQSGPAGGPSLSAASSARFCMDESGFQFGDRSADQILVYLQKQLLREHWSVVATQLAQRARRRDDDKVADLSSRCLSVQPVPHGGEKAVLVDELVVGIGAA